MKKDTFSEDSVWSHSCEIDSQHAYFLQSGSGKGKSTFAAYVMGLRTDYSGKITIDGKDQKKVTLDEWSSIRTKKLAFLAQDMRLFPNLTAGENLLIKNKLTDFKSEGEIKAMLGQLELDHKWEQRAGTLSLGQQQRVALIRSLLQPFELLLMDEPFSHIDKANIIRALKIILEECDKQQAGYILTTLGYDYGITGNKVIQL
ncbi:ABC transporter ATP-binding protein [Parvicella tangerina]|uniref:Vitamin B12 import ATP-binding protein BtuD n=1 Tax=Parvicella tangerina TaxID=2829795 RepID=A0A916NPJ9_9FLAO|nr:ATP-binding cassette domain-containing protein [Parvicella tangerina]CAG5076884.1 Vitamin B12 import ATP-binding protein BtuD [Parvicella tangerina]